MRGRSTVDQVLARAVEAGVILTQILPFTAPSVLRLFGEFEGAIYPGCPA